MCGVINRETINLQIAVASEVCFRNQCYVYVIMRNVSSSLLRGARPFAFQIMIRSDESVISSFY